MLESHFYDSILILHSHSDSELENTERERIENSPQNERYYKYIITIRPKTILTIQSSELQLYYFQVSSYVGNAPFPRMPRSTSAPQLSASHLGNISIYIYIYTSHPSSPPRYYRCRPPPIRGQHGRRPLP